MEISRKVDGTEETPSMECEYQNISSEIKKMAIISPKKKKQTKISSFFTKSS